MIIDVHIELDPRQTEPPDPAAAQRFVEAAGIRYALTSNPAAAVRQAGGRNEDELDANLAVLSLARACEPILPLYWVRPGRTDSSVHALAGALATEPFVGAVFAPLLNDFNADDRDLLDPYLRAVANANKIAVVRVASDTRANIDQAVSLARRHPNLPVLLYDPGRDVAWPRAIEETRQAAARGDARIYLSTAGTRPETLFKAAEQIPERLLFGTGGNLAADADAMGCRLLLEELRHELPAPLFEQITHTNARRLLRLNGTA